MTGTSPGQSENMDARSPIYVSTLFTLDSPQPWFTTVFVGGAIDERSRAGVCIHLYNIKLDGTELRGSRSIPTAISIRSRCGTAASSTLRNVTLTSRARRAGGSASTPSTWKGQTWNLTVAIWLTHSADAMRHRRRLVIFVESSQPLGRRGRLPASRNGVRHPTYRALTEDAGYVFLILPRCGTIKCLYSRRPARAEVTSACIASMPTEDSAN